MKKFYTVIILSIVALISFSCEENFSPKTEFEPKFALTSILHGDAQFQVATVFSSYPINNFDPYYHTDEPSVPEVDVRLWYNDTVYVFKDSTIIRDDTSRYKTPLNFYYLDDLLITKHDEPVEMVARFKNGRRLIAKTTTPTEFVINGAESSSSFPDDPYSIKIISMDESSISNSFFLVQFTITYYATVDGITSELTKEMPSYYIIKSGKAEAVYPEPSRVTAQAFSMDAIQRAFAEISENDENKSNYRISKQGELNIYGLDEALARYYSTSKNYNNFTVRLDEGDYSNVEGGFGIFGVLMKKSYSIRIDENFIKSFGYEVVDN